MPVPTDEMAPNGKAPDAAALPKEPYVGDIGFTGIYRYRGIISEEYNPDLAGLKRVEIYRQMVADGVVRAALTACKLPLMAATWTVETAGDSPQAKRAQELVEKQLFDGLLSSWPEELRRLLSCLQFGFSLAAKNWTVHQGEATIKELRPLHPRTVLQGAKRWEYDPDSGELLGVWQWGTDGFRWREEFIPAQYLIHLTHEGDFNNPEGTGLFRSIYKHWYFKDQAYRIWAIGIERGAVGTPWGQYPNDWPKDKQEELQQALSNLLVQEGAALTTTDNVKVTNLSLSSDARNILNFVHHHDAEIVKSVLAPFLNLGLETGRGGSFALSKDQTDFFLMVMQSWADDLCQVLTHRLVRDIVQYNLGTDQVPKLRCEVAKRDINGMFEALSKLAAGVNPVIECDDGLEAWVREIGGFPPREAPRIGTPGADETITIDGPASKPRSGKTDDGSSKGQDAPDDRGNGQGGDAGDDGGADSMSRRRGRLAICRGHSFKDPAAWGKEESANPKLGKLIDEFHGALADRVRELRADVWRIAKLPEPPKRAARFARLFKSAVDPLSAEETAALDQAIEAFLADVAGVDRTAGGFAGTASEDGLLQGYEWLAYSLGVNDAVRLTGADAAATAANRESAQVQQLLDNAFSRLSDQGRLKLESDLQAIQDMLVQAGVDGRNALDVAADLSGTFDAYEGWQFERLSRTEMAIASTAGSVDEYKAEGIGQLEFIVSGLACEICQAYAGQIVPVDDDDLPPWHPNCLCSVAPYVEGAVDADAAQEAA